MVSRGEREGRCEGSARITLCSWEKGKKYPSGETALEVFMWYEIAGTTKFEQGVHQRKGLVSLSPC